MSPAAVQPSLITVAGYSGSLQAVQGQPTSVPLDLFDTYNNPIASLQVNISTVFITVAIIQGGVVQPVSASLKLLSSAVLTDSDVVVCFPQSIFLQIVLLISRICSPIFQVTYIAPISANYLLSIRWNGIAIANSPMTVVAFESVEVTPALRSIAWYLSGVALLISLIFLILLALYRSTNALKAASPLLLTILLLGSLVYCIGLGLRGFAPSNTICTLSPFLLTCGFLIQCSVIFAKAYRIQKIFKSEQLQTVNLTDRQLLIAVAAITLTGITLHVAKVLSDPFVPVINTLASNKLLTYQTCSSGRYILWPIVLYGLQAFLVGFGVVMGFRTRNVPTHFNESGQIAAVIFNTAVISFVVLAVAYGLESVGPIPVFLIETFGLAYGQFFLLFVTFSFKFYVVWQSTSNENEQPLPDFPVEETPDSGAKGLSPVVLKPLSNRPSLRPGARADGLVPLGVPRSSLVPNSSVSFIFSGSSSGGSSPNASRLNPNLTRSGTLKMRVPSAPLSEEFPAIHLHINVRPPVDLKPRVYNLQSRLPQQTLAPVRLRSLRTSGPGRPVGPLRRVAHPDALTSINPFIGAVDPTPLSRYDLFCVFWMCSSVNGGYIFACVHQFPSCFRWHR